MTCRIAAPLSRSSGLGMVCVVMLSSGDPQARAAGRAIRSGDLEALRLTMSAHPELATALIRFPDGAARTVLHLATDWPGHFPRNVETVELLIAAGADVNARIQGPHTETPLHWAASSDDVDVLDALLDGGADIEADGAVIGGGTALTDATAFGQWRAAQRLIDRGARSTLFESAVMGLLDRVTTGLSGDPAPSDQDISWAFWGSCHGGQRQVAEHLLAQGAELELDRPVGWSHPTRRRPSQRARAPRQLADLARRSGVRELTQLPPSCPATRLHS